jgi:NAD(P)-dependent dehydrogenase (short-subunit alcohol dehydrogenase family)
MSTWLITGCSTGLGRAFAETALDRGHNVVATARDAAKVQGLADAYPDQALAVALASPTTSRSPRRSPQPRNASAQSTSSSTTPATATARPSRKARTKQSGGCSTPTSSALPARSSRCCRR